MGTPSGGVASRQECLLHTGRACPPSHRFPSREKVTGCKGFGFSRAKRGRFGVRGCGAKGGHPACAARQGRLALPRGVLRARCAGNGRGEPRSPDGHGDRGNDGPECRQTFLSAVANDWTTAKPHQPERGGSHPIPQGARPWARRRGGVASRQECLLHSDRACPPSHRFPGCERVAGCGGGLWLLAGKTRAVWYAGRVGERRSFGLRGSAGTPRPTPRGGQSRGVLRAGQVSEKRWQR